jgi:DNA repair protein RadC
MKTTSRIIVVREDPVASTSSCDSPEGVMAYWRGTIAAQPDYEPDKESLVVILLNTRLRAFAWHRVSIGSGNETIAHPRDILRPAIIGAAYGFVLVHNHPSGDPSPSRADRELTKRVAESASLMQINLVDHVIATDPGRHDPALTDNYFSFQESGLL